MVLCPGVQFNTVEGKALHADGDLGDVRPDLTVEPVSVHPEVEGGIPQSNEAGEQGYFTHRCSPRPGACVPELQFSEARRARGSPE